MRECLTQLRLLSHVAVDHITRVVVVLLEITFHEILNRVEVRTALHILTHLVDVAVHETQDLRRELRLVHREEDSLIELCEEELCENECGELILKVIILPIILDFLVKLRCECDIEVRVFG